MHKINDSVLQLLEKQLGMEYQAFYNYKTLAIWANLNDLLGIEKFFTKQSEEEKGHAERIVRFFLDRKAEFTMPTISEPTTIPYKGQKPSFKEVLKMFKIAMAQEMEVTENFYKITQATLDAKDFMTRQFVDYFLEEQREEEDLFDTIIDRIENVIGDSPMALYFIDKDVASFAE